MPFCVTSPKLEMRYSYVLLLKHYIEMTHFCIKQQHEDSGTVMNPTMSMTVNIPVGDNLVSKLGEQGRNMCFASIRPSFLFHHSLLFHTFSFALFPWPRQHIRRNGSRWKEANSNRGRLSEGRLEWAGGEQEARPGLSARSWPCSQITWASPGLFWFVPSRPIGAAAVIPWVRARISPCLKLAHVLDAV